MSLSWTHLILWSIPPSRRLIGILLRGQKAKLSREDSHLPKDLLDYSFVSNATIYESNFFHGYLHILSPVPCLVLMRPRRDERTWHPVSGDTGDDKDISYQSYRRQKVLYQFLSSLLLYCKIQSW